MTAPRSTADTATFDSLAAKLRLAMVSGIGPRTRKVLLSHFGSSAAVLAASVRELCRVPGVGPKLAREIAAAGLIDVDTELALCQEHGIAVTSDDQVEYPRLLHEIADPPGVLFTTGQLLPRDALAIAIVGTRHATAYGRKQAERLSGSLSRAGLTIVSGLARGIDAAAHQAALEAGGRTLAVLAGGLLKIYPPEHTELAGRIVQNGALISENPPRTRPLGPAFPRRNRLITGMSLGVVVVEASDRSGALISARHAMEQGRDVFAVPGRVDSRASRGCHQLIRDGAKLVESVEDVLEELGPLVEAAPTREGRMLHHPAEIQLNDQEQKVLDCVDTSPTEIDQVVYASGLPVHRVLSTISVLEMRHLIHRVAGNRVVRV